MDRETVIIRRTPPSFAYVFFVNGLLRGDHRPLNPEGTTIGRGSHAEVQLNDETVSDEHARIRKEGDEWFVYDLAATNPTAVAGEAVYRKPLADGDRITVGQTELVFRVLK